MNTNNKYRLTLALSLAASVVFVAASVDTMNLFRDSLNDTDKVNSLRPKKVEKAAPSEVKTRKVGYVDYVPIDPSYRYVCPVSTIDMQHRKLYAQE